MALTVASGPVTGHRAGIAETKINVGVAIHVGEVRAFGFLHKDRE